MRTITLTFGKDKTAIIKGIAIIFMIILHCGVPSWYDTTIPIFNTYCFITNYFSIFNLCVGIFTFMIGYGYAFSKKKDWHYSWSHIIKLLIPFWVILICFTFPIIIIRGEWDTSIVLLNLIGINSKYNWFSWFVCLYIYAMIVLPFVSRFIDKKPIIGAIGFITLAYVLEILIHIIPNWAENDWTQRLFTCFFCSPTIIFGYLFARKQWFISIRIVRHWCLLVLSVLFIIFLLILRHNFGSYLGFHLDFIYAPIFIAAVLVIFNLYKMPLIRNVLTELGNTSVYMWFFHALFFTSTVRCIYQPLILISNNLLIIIIWTITLTYISSKFIQVTVNEYLFKFINVSLNTFD